MSYYPAGEDEPRIAPAQLFGIVTSIFERCGMVQADAALLADTLVQADLHGIHSHGVLRVPEYVHKLRNGVDPRGRPRLLRDHGAAIRVDASNSMGQVAAAFAMQRVIERARETGVAAAAIGGSNHCGAMFYYARMALPEDMIGLATTNALPTMAPWGGADRIVGINPLAVAIPTQQENPIIFDAAFSYSSLGKIRVYQQKGISIPSDWAFDSEGVPTTDPARALLGLLRPIGEYKGVGLAVAMGVLSSLLSGAAYGAELGDLSSGPMPGRDGHFLLAIRVAAFEDPQQFKQRVDHVIRQIEGSRLAPGADRIYAPGGLEAETARRYSQEGIPLNRETWIAVNSYSES